MHLRPYEKMNDLHRSTAACDGSPLDRYPHPCSCQSLSQPVGKSVDGVMAGNGSEPSSSPLPCRTLAASQSPALASPSTVRAPPSPALASPPPMAGHAHFGSQLPVLAHWPSDEEKREQEGGTKPHDNPEKHGDNFPLDSPPLDSPPLHTPLHISEDDDDSCEENNSPPITPPMLPVRLTRVERYVTASKATSQVIMRPFLCA